MDIGDGFVDDLLRHGDSGVAASAKSLDLGDGGGTLVEAVAVLGADVAPAPSGGLGPAGEDDGLSEHVDQLLATLGVFLFAEDLGEKQHGEAVAVCVSVVAHGIADQPVGAAARYEVVDGGADVVGVSALRGRGALGKQSNSGQGRHRGGIAAVVGHPVSATGLVRDQPLQPAIDDPLHVGRRGSDSLGNRQQQQRAQGRSDC